MNVEGGVQSKQGIWVRAREGEPQGSHEKQQANPGANVVACAQERKMTGEKEE